MGNILTVLNIINIFAGWQLLTPQQKRLRFIGLVVFFMVFIGLISFLMSRGKEKFIGTDMWHGYTMHDSNKTNKEERTKSLQKISKGWLPGERPKSGGLLENFENTNGGYYNPRNYEISPDYHRTVQQFGVDPNPVESLETPEFMLPKTYRAGEKYELVTEVKDNAVDAVKLRAIESTFKNVEKNKFYKDLLNSKCRAGNRSSYKNCGCNAPAFGEY